MDKMGMGWGGTRTRWMARVPQGSGGFQWNSDQNPPVNTGVFIRIYIVAGCFPTLSQKKYLRQIGSYLPKKGSG